MAKSKKPVLTRAQRFRAEHRRSWGRFLGKLALFFIPVALATMWLIRVLLMTGTGLPVLALGLDGDANEGPGTEMFRSTVWDACVYGDISPDDVPQLPADKVRFGGPNWDTIVIFNDLLASARKFNDQGELDDEGQLQPGVFLPASASEHTTHAFHGLLISETTPQREQWRTFESYLIDLLQQVRDKSLRRPQRGRVIIALDIDHPDLPGRLPPQADQFMQLLSKQWLDSVNKSLQKKVADQFPSLDVFLWVSHAAGQQSYCDSDPKQVESFFKRSFEQIVTGGCGEGTISYQKMRDALMEKVRNEASVHYLAQTPTVFEPASFDDFTVQTFKGQPADRNGVLFTYSDRDATNTPRDDWEKFDRTRRLHNWQMEDPLRVQQCELLLLQMDRLWFWGRDKSTLYDELKGRLNFLCDNPSAVLPVLHTLHDAREDARRAGGPQATERLDASLIAIEPVDPSAGEQAAVDAENDRQSRIEQWRDAHPDWTGAMIVWSLLVEAESIDQALIQRSLALLNERQRLAKPSESVAGTVLWNEIAYLHRLANELSWPPYSGDPSQDLNNDHRVVENLVRLSLRARDRCNQFSASLSPVLANQFGDEFAQLENVRRLCEDMLFARDHLDLQLNLEQLIADFGRLTDRHDRLANQIELLQNRLITSPHEFRYCIQSLAAGRSDAQDERTLAWLAEFHQQREKAYRQTVDQLDLAVQQNAFDNLTQQIFPPVGTETLFANSGDEAADARFVGASVPAADQNSTAEAGRADGDLIRRRLLGWPNLPLDQRKRIYDDLAQAATNPGGEAANRDILESGLSPTLLDELAKVDWLNDETLTTESLARDEDYFVRMAADAHRLVPLPLDSDEALDQVACTNKFRAIKSMQCFRRVALDLWGTPSAGDASSSFAASSLQQHERAVRQSLDQISSSGHRDLTENRKQIVKAWNDQLEQRPWIDQIEHINQFSNLFGKWTWRGERAINRPLGPLVEIEQEQNNQLVFCLSSVPAEFGTVTFAEPEQEQDYLNLRPENPERIRGGLVAQSRIYLRGHQQILRAPRSAIQKSDDVAIVLPTENPGSTRIRVQRTSREVAGHVKIVIDCSNSMLPAGRGKRDKMKETRVAVARFLEESIASRGDLRVTLFAVGASRIFDGRQMTVRNQDAKFLDLAGWKRVKPERDVWIYSKGDPEQPINSSNVRRLTKAVENLRAFGETPLLDGLDLSIVDRAGTLPQLVVLITDGFEFQMQQQGGNWRIQPFDQPLYQKIRSRLNDPKTALALFSLFSGDIRTEFESMLPTADTDGLPESQIRQRIEQINALAEYRLDEGGNTRLDNFLTELLPQPTVNLTAVQKSIPFARSENGLVEFDNLPTQKWRPAPWTVSVKAPSRSSVAYIFGDQESVDWVSSRPAHGNEVLKFEYDPAGRTPLTLRTEFNPQESDQPVSLGDQQHRLRFDVRKTSDSIKPLFQLATDKANELTVAPALALLELTQKRGDANRSILIQDFVIRQQRASNVHPIEFPEIRKLSVLENPALLGRDAPVNSTCYLMDNFSPQFWTKIRLGKLTNELSYESDNGVTGNLEFERYVDVGPILSQNRDAEKFYFRLKYEKAPTNNRDEFDLTMRIGVRQEFRDSQTPVDQWLVQPLEENQTGTELHRTCSRLSTRSYFYRRDRSGISRMHEIEHKFRIDVADLQKHADLALGIANFGQLTDADKKFTIENFYQAQ